jgi:hypothetical protein
MKLLTDNKGQIRVIEALFAAVLLISSLTLIPTETHVEGSNDEILRCLGQYTLIELDSDGSMSRLIENGSWTTLRKCVQSLLSPAIWFNLTVFDEGMNPMNQIQISSGSPINEKIVATEYICASRSRDYRIYVVRLQLSNVN